MGGKVSKASKGTVLNKPGEGSQPVSPPYHGPSAMYHFVTYEVTLKHHIGFGTMITTNVDAYYPILAETHARGLKMLTFYRIPGEMRPGSGLFSPDILVPFQGIFCSYPSIEATNRSTTQYALRVEKSVIQPEMAMTPFMTFQHEVTTNTHHLHQTLARYANSGSRLICIEITGQESLSPALFNTKMPALGCDLFFEEPIGEISERYVYTCVCIPIHVTFGFASKPTVQCDWIGTLSTYLSQGWRLVEIFYDKTSRYQTSSAFSTNQNLNSQWYFEKPASRINDPTPMYQGTIVEHEIHIKGYTTTTGWESVIQDMGNKGWELACVLETPEQRFSVGFVNTVHQKTLLFFQRPYIPN